MPTLLGPGGRRLPASSSSFIPPAAATATARTTVRASTATGIAPGGSGGANDAPSCHRGGGAAPGETASDAHARRPDRDGPPLSPSSDDRPDPPARRPSPPPDVPEVQLKMWGAVLRRRGSQVRGLSPRLLRAYAAELRADLETSRGVANGYCGGEGVGGATATATAIDLAGGRYSAYYLDGVAATTTSAAATPEDVLRHLLALFYRSVDARLSNAMRKHGIDAVKRALGRLEHHWSSREEEEEEGRGEGEEARGVVGEGRDDEIVDGGSGADADGGENSGFEKKRRRGLGADIDSGGGHDGNAGSMGEGRDYIIDEGSGVDGRDGTMDSGARKRRSRWGSDAVVPVVGEACLADNDAINDGSEVDGAPSSSSCSAKRRRGLDADDADGERDEDDGDAGPRSRPGGVSGTSDGGGGGGVDGAGGGDSFRTKRRRGLDECDGDAGPRSRPERVSGTSDDGGGGRVEEGSRKDPPKSSATGGGSAGTAPSSLTRMGQGEVLLPPGPSRGEVVGVMEAAGGPAPPRLLSEAEAEAPSSARGGGGPRSIVDDGAGNAALLEARRGGAANVNNDLIDLTADSDDDLPPTTTTVAAMADPCVPPASDRAVKRMDEAEGAGISSVLPARPPLPSPPASPPPYATIRDPPPSPGHRPRPFADVRMYSIRADVPPIASGSLTSRPQCVVAYDAGYQLGGVGTCLDDALCIDVRERLKTWEPYWKIVEVR